MHMKAMGEKARHWTADAGSRRCRVRGPSLSPIHDWSISMSHTEHQCSLNSSRYLHLLAGSFSLGLAFLMPSCGDAPLDDVSPTTKPLSATDLQAARREGRAISVAGTDSATGDTDSQREAERQQIRRDQASHPERPARTEHALRFQSDYVHRRSDGNYDVTIQRQEGPTTVVTMGEDFIIAEKARSLREAPSHANRIKLYHLLRQATPADEIARLRLPNPSEAGAFSAEALGELLEDMADQLQALAPQVAALASSSPSLASLACSAEEGAGMMGDGAQFCSHDPAGIFSRIAFPQREHQSCVKDQGNRGTCVSFAITAAVETSASILHGRHLNLSEQDLYRYAKWKEGSGSYGDGLYTGDAARAAMSYRFGFEREWTYNPSHSRIDTKTSYRQSCLGYRGPYCSDSNHQADVKCLTSGTCYYVDSAPKSSGFSVATATEYGTNNLGRSVAKSALRSGRLPAVLSFEVTTSFRNPSRGVVTYRSAESSSGGHAILLIGFVRNSELPPGTPPAAGDGYFIARNSWGCGFGDGGYVYLPDSFVAEYGLSLLSVVSN